MAADHPIGSALEGFTRGFIRAREEVQQRQIRAGAALYEAAKNDPTLFDDPDTAKQITAYLGGKEPFELIRTFHQSQGGAGKQAFGQAQALGLLSPDEVAQTQQLESQAEAARAANVPRGEGVTRSLLRGAVGAVPVLGPFAAGMIPEPSQPPRTPVPDPYAGAQQKLVQRGSTLPGTTVRMTEKGGTAVSVTGPTRSEVSEAQFYGGVEQRRQELMAEGASDTEAYLRSIREATQFANENGIAVPKEARELAEANSIQQVQVKLKKAIRAGERAIELDTERAIRREGEMGSREAKIGAPISPDETAAARAQDVAMTLEQAGQPLSTQQLAVLTDRFRREASATQVGAEAEEREAGAARGRMRPGATQPTPPADRKALQETQNVMDDLNKVFELFNPQMLGRVRGKFTNLKGYFGALGVDEERLRTNVFNVQRRIRIATTGAAGPVEELNRLTDQTVNVEQSPQQFFARMMELARQARDTHANITDTLKANNEVAPPLEMNPQLQAIIDKFEAEDAQRNAAPAAAGAPAAPQLPAGWKYLGPVQ